MNHSEIIEKLNGNKNVFRFLLEGMSDKEILWKPQPEKWCLLEIVCHLYDEECEDFRARLKHTFETPGEPMPKIDPKVWVSERKYLAQNYTEMLSKFMQERDQSIAWLNSLESPPWKNVYIHPKAGELSAEMFLTNWLAHDYLHFRQITFTKYQYLVAHYNTRYDYAGNW